MKYQSLSLLGALLFFSFSTVYAHEEPAQPLSINQLDQEAAAQLYQQGKQAYDRGSYEEAIALFKKCQQKYPQTPFGEKSQMRMISAYMVVGRFDKAKQAVSDFMILYSNNNQIHKVLRMQQELEVITNTWFGSICFGFGFVLGASVIGIVLVR